MSDTIVIIIVVVISVCVILFTALVILATIIFVRMWRKRARSSTKNGPSHQQAQYESQSVIGQSRPSPSIQSSVRNSVNCSLTPVHSRSDNNGPTRNLQASDEQSTHSVIVSGGFSNFLATLNPPVIPPPNSATVENAHGPQCEVLEDNYDHLAHKDPRDKPMALPAMYMYDEPYSLLRRDEASTPAAYFLLGRSTDDSVYSYAKIVEENKRQDIYKSVRPYTSPAQKESEIYTQLKSCGISNISHQVLSTTGHLGSGQFGMVEKGLWKNGMTNCELEVALKTLYIGSSKEDKVRFLQEAAIMAQFRHPNVILIFGVVQREPMTIVVELAHKGDLRKYLNAICSNPGKRASTNLSRLLLNFSQQIALGMQYLAGKGFVHRDLAARNILLARDNVCKIADFGMARDLADEEYYISKGGKIPVKWTAPEAIEYKKYSTASDVWSYGCVLYEIWSLGKKPFDTITNLTLVKLLRKGMRLPPPPGCPESIYDLMIKCWHPDKKQRPQFRKVFLCLVGDESEVLLIPQSALATHKLAGILGAPIEAGERMYLDLRRMYEVPGFDYASITSLSSRSTNDPSYY